ncbi:MAG: hypothetical protein HC859_03775 [Bacteroidia bacterium]|nr:hypothetical protein [Bacteroidia bacterium]
MVNNTVTVIGLIRRAMQGGISLEEFYASWPKELEDITPYKEVYLDIENAIEHFPGNFFTGEPKRNEFKNSDEYRQLDEHLRG